MDLRSRLTRQRQHARRGAKAGPGRAVEPGLANRQTRAWCGCQLLASGRADGEASMSVLARLDLRRAGGRSEWPLLPLPRCCSPCAPTRRPNLSEESGMLLRCRFDASSQTSALRDQSAMPGRCSKRMVWRTGWPEIKAVVFRLGYGRRLGPRIGIDLRRRRSRALE